MRAVMRIIAAFIACLAIFAVLKLAVGFIPVAWLQPSLESSVATLVSEGESSGRLIADEPTTQMDNYTTALVLNMCASDHGNLLESAFASWHHIASGSGANAEVAALAELVAGDVPADSPAWASYARYWNGEIALIKPLLIVLDLAGIRVLFTLAAFALLLAGAIALGRATSALGGFAYALPFAIVLLPVATMSLSLAFTFLIALAATLYTIRVSRSKGLQADAWAAPFFVFGALTAFFDMLCTPLITLGIPLGVLIFLEAERCRNMPTSTLAAFMAAVLISWAAGYGLCWAADWVIATIVLGWDVIGDAIAQLGMRTSASGIGSEAIRQWSGLSANIGALPIAVWIVLAVAVGGGIIAAIALRNRIRPGNARAIVLLAIVAALPFLWYLVTANHSYVHFWFTYRAQVIAIMCILMALLVAFGPEHRRQREVLEHQTQHLVQEPIYFG